MLGTPPSAEARYRTQGQNPTKSSRGLRSRMALGLRRAKRSANRRFSRKLKRYKARRARDPATSPEEYFKLLLEEKEVFDNLQPSFKNVTNNSKANKWGIGKKYKATTLNIQGLGRYSLGKRELLEI